jgi:predicted TIM-barrel fold metal-dependent hydrolase
MGRVVDFRVVLPFSEWMEPDAGSEASYLSNYGRVYTGDTGELGSAEATLQALVDAGVDLAVLQAEWAFGDYRAMNRAVARLVRRYPDKLVGFATINPAEGDDMADVARRAVEDLGLRGINLQPFAYRVHANDKCFYPLYEACQELGIAVTIHASINFSSDRPIDYGRPLYLCEVACDFPDLAIVANHGGWPWVTEMVAVAWKHPNVWIEIGAVSPKYIGRPGTGWEPLMTYGNTSLLADRVLFATDSMLPVARCLAELNELQLKPEVLEKWRGENAVRLLEKIGALPKGV